MNNISLKPWSLETKAIDLIQQVAELFDEKDLCFGHGTDNPLDEAMTLVFFALGVDYPYRRESSSIKVSDEVYNSIMGLVNQRIFEKKPLSYLTQEAFFCGHKFYVDERVLIPRSPIAELIRNQFAPWLKANSVQRVLDIATGSGCLAIAIAKSFPSVQVIASDVSKEALEVAKINIEKLSVRKQVTLVESDLFENIKGEFDLIVSNPPYVNPGSYDDLPAEYLHEPDLALIAPDNGLDFIARILHDAPPFLKDDGILTLEMGETAKTAEQTLGYTFKWIELENGGEGVAVIDAKHLK
ncbi:MAG: 50S ribosomal protein L3 N(5)-glutamine methyltransferase [Gammaproteobacteria bacterium]|nr:50S ribosomal protein L3 N(5)-glutamine methyltransferase [Gammaproteobacteria bacterium]